MAFSEMTKDLTDESPIIYFENIDTFAPCVHMYLHRKSSSNLEFRTILFLSYSSSCGASHTIYTRNNMGQKCEGVFGLWVLNEILKKTYPENLKKIVGAVWELPAK